MSSATWKPFQLSVSVNGTKCESWRSSQPRSRESDSDFRTGIISI
jgi:hypothetical protein